jgi:hypothetical protein
MPGYGEPAPKANWLARVVGGIGLVAVAHRMAQDQADDDIPGITTPNPRAEKIAKSATALVEGGATDEQVLEQATEMARGKTRDLRIASTLVRQDGVG